MNNENELLNGCIAGNRILQNQLYKQFAASMMVVCLRYAHSRQDAEEILQEGFVKVFSHLGQYKHKGSLGGWIKTIIVHCAIEKLRSTQKEHQMLTVMETDDNLADEELILDGIQAKEVIVLVQQLPLMSRIVFNLYVFENKKHREIAGLLNIPAGTSKSHLHNARLLLQQWLHKQNKNIYINAGA